MGRHKPRYKSEKEYLVENPMRSMMDWRKIEQALVEIATSYVLPMHQDEGESFIHISGRHISLEDVAKELAERLK